LGNATVTKNQVLLKWMDKLRSLYRDLFKAVSSFTALLTKRSRVLKIAFAMVTLMFLSGTLSGFMLARVMSANQTSNTFAAVGTLKAVGVGVYANAGLTASVTTIDWGVVEAGGQKSFTVYIRNEGNAPVVLSQTTSNWNPPTASQYFSLSWDYNGQTVSVNGSVRVTFTLTVSAAAAGLTNFGFDITVLGSG